MRLDIINSKIPICPECNSKMTVNLIQEMIKCHHCKAVYKIIELGRNEKDFICERKGNGKI